MNNIAANHSFRFLHAADIHLDSPLKGLSKIENSPMEKICQSTRDAFTKLVDAALEKEVDFVILSGDIFDRDSPSTMTRRFFIKEMQRLSEKDIPAYIIWGNHDAKNTVFKKTELPKNVHCFDSIKPESISLKMLPVVIHGQSYEDNSATKNLALHYPPSIQDKFNIGVLHTSLDGFEGYGTYAPCDMQTLKMKGYDYWALGHIHKRQELHRDPCIIYPGNIQGRHIHESGEKGCMIVDVQQMQIQQVQFHPLDSLRWELLTIDVSRLETIEQIIHAAKMEIEKIQQRHPGYFLVFRMHLTGPTPLHWKLHANLTSFKETLEDAFWEDLSEFWIEKIKLFTTPQYDVMERKDGLGDLATALNQAAKDPECRQYLADACQEFVKVIPEEMRTQDSYLNAIITGQQDEFLQEILHFVTARLITLENKS